MRTSVFETVAPNAPISVLPARLQLAASRVSPILVLILVLPFALTALAPFALIAGHPAVLTLIARFETSIPLTIALLAWTLLFDWPIASALAKLGRRQTVSLRAGSLRVIDRSVFSRSAWSAPLKSYSGIAHHVRASLSGTRHELILVHPDPARSILLRTSPAISQREIDDLTQLLGCREITPRIFYRKESGALLGTRDTGTTPAAPSSASSAGLPQSRR